MLTNIICDKTRRKHMSHKSHIMKHNNYLYFQLLLNDISITFFKLKVYKFFLMIHILYAWLTWASV